MHVSSGGGVCHVFSYKLQVVVLIRPSVFDLSVSGRTLAGSEGPGPLNRKQKQACVSTVTPTNGGVKQPISTCPNPAVSLGPSAQWPLALSRLATTATVWLYSGDSVSMRRSDRAHALLPVRQPGGRHRDPRGSGIVAFCFADADADVRVTTMRDSTKIGGHPVWVAGLATAGGGWHHTTSFDNFFSADQSNWLLHCRFRRSVDRNF